MLASLAAGAIGLVDDVRGGISFQVRFAAQVAVAAVAVVVLGTGVSVLPVGVLLAGAAIGVVGYINAFNFMDGINGISVASAVVAGAMFAVVGRLENLALLQAGGVAITAACVGFLPFNFPTARAFLGDVGSYFIGAWIAILAYIAVLAGVRLDVVGAPLALYVADVGFTLAARVRRGEQWHAAHRDHVYQKLASGGLGHTFTTLVVLATSTALSALGLVSLCAPAWRPVAWLAMAILLGAYLAAPSLLGRQQRRAKAIRSGGATGEGPIPPSARAPEGPGSP